MHCLRHFSTETLVGAERIKDLLREDTTGGLSYAYYKTHGDPDMPASESRGGWA